VIRIYSPYFHMQDTQGMRIAKMIGWTSRRLSEIAPEEMAGIKRQAHLARSQAARALLGAAWRWLAGVVRDAGVAAQLSEAPRPYPARYPVPRNRLCS
jgi:hypothetical protein